jgi:hypothetical protein
MSKIQKLQDLGITEISQRSSLLGNIMTKHVSAAMDMPPVVVVLLEAGLPGLPLTNHFKSVTMDCTLESLSL